MSNPTSNYNFQMPTSTDLVTDLPADFEVFGQAVDTQMKTNADAAIAKSIVDAKGDLIAATAADTVTRLAIGTNDQVLTADSTAATGMKWATPSSGGMTLLSTTTLSGATVTISSISQAYNSLFIIITGVTNATADGRFRCAPNGNTTITTTVVMDATTTLEQFVNNYIPLTASGMVPSRTDANNSYSLYIHNYTSATSYKPISGTSGYFVAANRASFYSGQITTNSAITSLVFSNASGNLSTGTVLIYGVK